MSPYLLAKVLMWFLALALLAWAYWTFKSARRPNYSNARFWNLLGKVRLARPDQVEREIEKNLNKTASIIWINRFAGVCMLALAALVGYVAIAM